MVGMCSYDAFESCESLAHLSGELAPAEKCESFAHLSGELAPAEIKPKVAPATSRFLLYSVRRDDRSEAEICGSKTRRATYSEEVVCLKRWNIWPGRALDWGTFRVIPPIATMGGPRKKHKSSVRLAFCRLLKN